MDDKIFYTVQEVVEDLKSVGITVSKRRVQAMIKQKHFRAMRCTCGVGWLISGDDYRAYKRKRLKEEKKK